MIRTVSLSGPSSGGSESQPEQMNPMSGDLIMKGLIALYTVAALGYAYEGSWPKFLYFLGSVILSLGVLWMK